MKTKLHLHYPGAERLTVTGSSRQLGEWKKPVAAQSAAGNEAVFEVDVPAGKSIELKARLGNDWEIGSNVRVEGGQEVDLYPHFQPRAGAVRELFPTFYSHRLDNERPIYAYFPPSYDENPTKRYPVLYVQDGQNVFDAIGNRTVEPWHMEGVLDDLIGRGEIPEVIVVAVPHGVDRLGEYGPVYDPDEKGGGKAEDYVSFLFDELKPQVDRFLRTETGPSSTMVLGSSMGGLVSLYAAHTRPEMTSKVAALSPSAWWNDDWLAKQVKTGAMKAADLERLWVDYGDYANDGGRGTEVLKAAYAGHGLVDGDGRMGTMVALGRPHSEWAWAERLPRVLRFLLN